MSNRPEEISSILREQIRNYKSKIEMAETGTVITVGDGIARVYGLRSCMANELLRFEDGSYGMAQNLEEDTVSVAVLSDKLPQGRLLGHEPQRGAPMRRPYGDIPRVHD